MGEENFKYIIKNKIHDNYLQTGTGEEIIYTPSIKTAIHKEIPSWIKGCEAHLKVIRSDTQEFKDLTKRLDGEEVK